MNQNLNLVSILIRSHELQAWLSNILQIDMAGVREKHIRNPKRADKTFGKETRL